MDQIRPLEIKIYLSTNIPEEKENYKHLTRGMLSNEELTESNKSNKEKIKDGLPYFTTQVEYPKSELKKLPYSDIVKFFFDKKVFLNKLEKMSILPDDEMSERIINHNIMVMLELLLPTQFPVKNFVSNSADLYNNGTVLNTLYINPFKEPSRVYINFGGTKYTISRVIWLNDFLNHPKYRKWLLTNNKSTLNNYVSSNEKINDISALKPDEIKEVYQTTCGKKPDTDIYVGVNKNDKNFEIYVDLELIEGELTLENYKSVYCAYFSEYLGNELEALANKKKPLYKGEIAKRPLFSITKLVAESTEKTEEETKESGESSKYNKIDKDVRYGYENIIDNIWSKDETWENIDGDSKSQIKKESLFFFMQDFFKDLIPLFKKNGKFETLEINKLNEIKSKLKKLNTGFENKYSYGIPDDKKLFPSYYELIGKIIESMEQTNDIKKGGNKTRKYKNRLSTTRKRF
jgi:hypothetical protein